MICWYLEHWLGCFGWSGNVLSSFSCQIMGCMLVVSESLLSKVFPGIANIWKMRGAYILLDPHSGGGHSSVIWPGQTGRESRRGQRPM